jgi:hypothetical protein
LGSFSCRSSGALEMRTPELGGAVRVRR